MDPELIMSIVVTLIILAVGVFAFLTVANNLPVQEAQSSYTSATATQAITNPNSTTNIYIDPTFRNNTNLYSLITLEAYGKYGGTTDWWTVQTAGNANGSFGGGPLNAYYTVDGGTVHTGTGGTGTLNTSFRLHYFKAGEVTNHLENSTYYALDNVTGTGDSVFNIIGIVLIIGAIMTIIGLVYSYMRPRY